MVVKNRKALVYNAVMFVLALISIIMVLADFSNVISLDAEPYFGIDNGILIIFAIDYFYRFAKATDKKSFFIHNMFDLLSIIPFSSAFSIFRLNRVTRMFRMVRFFRILRLTALVGRAKKNLQHFLETNGLIYLVYIDLALLLFAAGIYSFAEKIGFWEALWWAVVTTTTVGYGDVSPTTVIGKALAIILMFVGIGMIGMLTSALTSFFSANRDDDISHIRKTVDAMHESQLNSNLEQDLTTLKDLLDKGLINEADFEAKKKRLLN